MPEELPDLLTRCPGVSLKELDQRAALLHRVDTKYAVQGEELLRLFTELCDDHQVLEIDGCREFGYRTTYLETPDRRCFTDHVEGHLPRFKARTRLYVESEQCVFEVKLKRSDDETDKRQIDYSPRDSERMTDEARQCLREALADAGIDPPDEFAPSLHTAFRRITLGQPTACSRRWDMNRSRLASTGSGRAWWAGPGAAAPSPAPTCSNSGAGWR